MTSALATWLDARDAATLEPAWKALASEALEPAWPGATITGHGAAQLAADLLGWSRERVAWLALPGGRTMEAAGAPAASFRTNRPSTFCYLEQVLECREPCEESWELREERDGARGVQWLTVGFQIDDGSRDGVGTGGTVVRVFDLEAGIAASVLLDGRKVALITPPHRRGEIAARTQHALDLYRENRRVRVPAWTSYDRNVAGALVAALAAAVAPTFAAGLVGPGEMLRVQVLKDGRGHDIAVRDLRFAMPTDPDRAILVREHVPEHAAAPERVWAVFTLVGLSWGHAFEVSVEVTSRGCTATLIYRLPTAAREAVAAVLAACPDLAIEP